jgi:uncharacterized protein
MSEIQLHGIPGPLEWKNTPAGWQATGSELAIEAGPETDWYTSPLDGKVNASAPILLFRPHGDFILTARVTLDAPIQWDAGCLMVYESESSWAKFALEVSAYGEPTIVTVVTRRVSDDCNSTATAANSALLRVARKGDAIIFYAALEGRTWRLVRAFRFGPADADLQVGFASQSPIGQGTTARFSEIAYEEKSVADIFSGE